MFSDFPNLHPLVVHFPIVLILLSAGLQVFIVFKNAQQVRWGALIIMGGGFAGALLASTIFHAMPAGLPTQAMEIFNEHERYSEYTLWLAGITFLLRGIGEYYKEYRRPYEISVLVFALLAAVFLSLAGHRGAQLVYVEGVGPKGNLLMKGAHHHGGSIAGTDESIGHDDMDAHTKAPSSGQPTHENMPGMTMPESSHSTNTTPKEKQQTNSDNNTQMPGHDMSTSEGMSNHNSMSGMNHGQQSAKENNAITNMPAMDHANMSGMKNQPNNQNNKATNPNMTGMDHSTMPMPTQGHRMGNMQNTGNRNKPTGTENRQGMEMNNMPGMNHTGMPAPSQANPGENMPEMKTTPMPGMEHGKGMNTMGNMNTGVKTDMNGRPLIDPSKPYDNNPAWEQNKTRKKLE